MVLSVKLKYIAVEEVLICGSALVSSFAWFESVFKVLWHEWQASFERYEIHSDIMSGLYSNEMLVLKSNASRPTAATEQDRIS